MTSSDRYLYNIPNKDQQRYYQICEAEDGDGWVVCWHTQYGQGHHPVKKCGRFKTVEDAQTALDELAIRMGMRYWYQYPERTRYGMPGEWRKAGQ